jgi:hypothetical protein
MMVAALAFITAGIGGVVGAIIILLAPSASTLSVGMQNNVELPSRRRLQMSRLTDKQKFALWAIGFCLPIKFQSVLIKNKHTKRNMFVTRIGVCYNDQWVNIENMVKSLQGKNMVGGSTHLQGNRPLYLLPAGMEALWG